ncbi:MAG: response regulator [Acidobacteriota bacterium]
MSAPGSSDRLHALRGLSARLVEVRELDDLLWILARSLGVDFGLPDCVIYLVDGDELVQRAAFGPKNPARRDIRDPLRIRLGTGVTGTAAVERRSIRIDDVRGDPRYIADVYSGVSELAVPIVYGERILGVIDSEADEIGYYGDDEQTTLEIVAHVIAPRIVSALEEGRRKRAESDLVRSRTRFLELADSIDGVVWEADAETLRFLYVSQRACSILGHPLAMWLGPPGRWLDMVHPEDRERARTARREVADGGDGRAVEYRMLCANGEVVWMRDVLSTTLSLDAAARPVRRLCGVMIDVTEQRRHHEEVLAASRAKSEFLSNMSHELRTPMNAVVGLTELLADADLPERQRSYLELVSRSASGLLRLFDDLFDLSRIEAGRVEIERRPFALAALVDDLLAVLQPSAAEKGLELASTIDPSVPRRLLGDALRLRQVLLNLVGNGIKFTDAGRVDLFAAHDGETLKLEVRDTGPGIPRDQADAVFERFHQLDSSAARSHGGVGLGLPIARQLVELMGGRLELQPTAMGASFVLRLPFAAVASPARSAEVSETPEKPMAVRVLVVEDNPVNQIVARAQLESLGCRVVVVDGGREALEQLRGVPLFDLVFMDCQMPVLDGYQTTRRIRRLSGAAARVPVVAMTAHAMTGDREKCLAAGMNDYLAKPVQLQDLQEMLVRWTDPERSPGGAS